MARERVAMALRTPGERGRRALEELRRALPGASLGEPQTDDGIVEIELDAASREDALEQVWNAVAAAGVDDHLMFAEHPDLPEHYRRRQGGGAPGAPA